MKQEELNKILDDAIKYETLWKSLKNNLKTATKKFNDGFETDVLNMFSDQMEYLEAMYDKQFRREKV